MRLEQTYPDNFSNFTFNIIKNFTRNNIHHNQSETIAKEEYGEFRGKVFNTSFLPSKNIIIEIDDLLNDIKNDLHRHTKVCGFLEGRL